MNNKDRLTAKDIRKAAKFLEKVSGGILRVEDILQVENPKVGTDFLNKSKNQKQRVEYKKG